MICPCCNHETRHGKIIFMGLQGFVPMVGSFTADDEVKKGFLHSKTQDAVIIQGLENEAYYCEECSLIFPQIKLKENKKE